MTLPAAVYSHLGPVPVSLAEKIKGADWGMFWYGTRRIDVLRDQCEAARLATLGHEVAHVMLYDAGAAHDLTPHQLERACDVFGAWLAAAIRAGYVTLQVPDGAL